jgi:hypothetical protein
MESSRLLMVHRQLECPDSLMRHPLVWEPLVDSLIHGLLLVADHPYRDARQLLLPLADRQRSATRWASSRPDRTCR